MSDPMNPHAPSPAEQLRLYLRILCATSATDRWLDVRWRVPAHPMRRRFIAAQQPRLAERLIDSRARHGDVYVGVALRNSDSHGGRASVPAAHLAWIESDNPRSAALLESFPYPPSMLIASGTPGHLQAYWTLDRRCDAPELERLNRRLACALAADPGCTDAARILRPPGTLNHKHAPPRPVILLRFNASVPVALEQLDGALPADPDPPVWRPAPRHGGRVGRTVLDRKLLAIPAAEYARVLASRKPNGEGKILCPFHEDSHPSLQLYPDGGFYCFGSGCRRGGSIFDFAGYMWGIDPRGAAFLQLRERLAIAFALNTDVGLQAAVDAWAPDAPRRPRSRA
jgi:CHC2 zinc finger